MPNLETTYVVQKGDTLYSIARKFNTTVNELKRINNLTSDILSLGDKLLIYELEEVTPNKYIVQKGDTLYSIANKFNTTVGELINLNNLSSVTLSIGQEIVLPQTQEGVPPTNSVPLPEELDTYTVQKGDSLWSIAQKFDLTVNDIIAINNLSTINLQIGDILLVPKKDNLYIVQKGDTLWSIAKKNNISVNELKELNNLTNNLLSVGQQLIVRK